MRMKWGEKGSNDENGEMMEDDLYWLIARWKRRKKKAEGDDDDVGVEWREHVDVDQGAWPKAVVDRRDDHMVVNFYKCAVNLRKISSNWENRTIIYVPLLEILKMEVVEDWSELLRLWSGDGFETKVRVFSK